MAYVDDFPTDARIVRWNMAVAFLALGVGGLFGMIQALHRTGIFRGFVSSADYYTVLTGHGVLLALVFTIFALCGVFTWGVTRSLDRPLPNPRFSIAWFGLMLVGALLAAVTILGLSPISFIDRLFSAISPGEVVTTYIKSEVFMWAIVTIAAYYGLQVRGGAQQIGRATTSSVVASIFGVILIDVLFSLLALR